MNSHDTRNAIEALLAGKPVPVEKTKVFGCSIKWSDKRESVKKSLQTWAKEEVDLKLIDEKGIRALVKNDGKKLRLINVWATWCGPCVAELPEFVTMNRMYRHRDFELVTISADSPEEKEKALEVLKKKQVSATNYLFDGNDKYKLMDAVDEKSSGAAAAHDPDRPRRQGALQQVRPVRAAGDQEGDRRLPGADVQVKPNGGLS